MIDRIPKVINPERENEPRFHFTWRTFIFISIIILIAFGLYGLFFSVYFQAKNIELKGDTDLVEAEQVKKVVLFALQNQPNIFLFDDKLIEAKIKENFPLVAEVEIQKGIPDTIRITILKRQPVIVWQTGEKKYLVDKEGMAYAEADEAKAAGLPRVIDDKNIAVNQGEKIVSRSFINFVREMIEKFTPRSNLAIKEMRISETTFDLTVMTQNNFYVLFDTTRSAETELDDLRRVLAHLKGALPKEYIDLRVEGWAYYK